MENKLKHIDLIQGVINRLSSNSFLLKGWGVTLVCALFALSSKDSKISFVFLAYIPSFIFWGLDAYFLSKERAYRELYDSVRLKSPNEIDFSMDVSNQSNGWFSTLISKTLLTFYGALILSVLIVTLCKI